MDLEDISPSLVRAVISSEDARFCSHFGIDLVELQNALDDEDGRFRGASTITMQTVKNLFLWTGRDWVRKAVEAPLALYADLVLPKRRIMEIYLNVAEWGEGTYGAEAASQKYFGVPAAKLSSAQAARLAAILPAPTTRDAGSPSPGVRRIARRIASRAAQSRALRDMRARIAGQTGAERLYAGPSSLPRLRRRNPLGAEKCQFLREKPRA